MIGCAVLLLACLKSSAGDAPPYVESNELFTYASTYLSLRLAPQDGEPDIWNEIGRTYHSFGVFVGLAASTARQYVGDTPTPLDIIYKEFPYYWNHYAEVSSKTIDVLNEAAGKVTLIVDLINSCGAVSVDDCNESIEQKVKESPEIYKESADLLISLGTAGAVIRNNADHIDKITKENREVPYLLHHAQDVAFRGQLATVKKAYDNIKRIQLRRSAGSQ